MPTIDSNHVLFKIAHRDLYERNPFNLLHLPVTATARDIRRRKEDIEAEAFADVLPLVDNRKPPTREEVLEAFVSLEEPEKRMAYALFWFWPDAGTGERSYELLFTDRGTVERWTRETDMLPAGQEKAVVAHNLAVFHHLMALGYEQSLLTNPAWKGSTPDAVEEHWETAIELWNATAEDADAWHLVSDMVSALGDPRLDYRFARSLRDQFAFAFDQINVGLAIAFAKSGREGDAKRQVEYMRLSQPEADDVEGTFDDAFAGLLRQTEAIVKAADEETDKNPRDGLRQANAILQRTDEPLRVSRIVFDKGAPIRNAIVTTIFRGVRRCLIAYGNKTQDWDECLKITAKLKLLAETPEQVRMAEDDNRAVSQNKKTRDERDLCWFCKRNKAVANCEVTIPMYGDVQHDFLTHQIRWRTIKLRVPRCTSCKSKTAFRDFFLKNSWIFLFLLFGLGGIVVGAYDGFSYSLIADLLDVRHPQGATCLLFAFLDGMGILLIGWIVLMMWARTYLNINFLSKRLYAKYGPPDIH